MKKNYKPKREKYSLGSIIQSPNTTLAENDIKKVKAMQEALNSPLTMGLDILGGAAVNYGMQGVQKGISSMAMGGSVNHVPVEVEGNEVGQTPQGDLLNFQGPGHEDGGIPVTLPVGTEIYSDRIKIDNVSMADRKKKREKKTMKLEELLEKRNSDILLKNSLKRTKQTNSIEEQRDTQIQDLVKNVLQPMENTEEFSLGGITGLGEWERMQNMLPYLQERYNATDVEKIPMRISQSSVPQNTMKTNPFSSVEYREGSNTNLDFIKNNNLPLGDIVGLAGNMVSTFGTMKNTKANRAGDTPNINAFENFGKDSLKTIDDSKGYINQIRDTQLQDLELARNASTKRGRNSAIGVNTMRAMDLATQASANNNRDNIYSQSAAQMMNILMQEAQMKAQKDQVVMGGEQAKDLANRQDRDNYFTQMARDIASVGTGLQETGYDINKIKERKVTGNVINNLPTYLKIDIMTGVISEKQGMELFARSKSLTPQEQEELSKLKTLAEREAYLKSKGV